MARAFSVYRSLVWCINATVILILAQSILYEAHFSNSSGFETLCDKTRVQSSRPVRPISTLAIVRGVRLGRRMHRDHWREHADGDHDYQGYGENDDDNFNFSSWHGPDQHSGMGFTATARREFFQDLREDNKVAAQGRQQSRPFLSAEAQEWHDLNQGGPESADWDGKLAEKQSKLCTEDYGDVKRIAGI